MPKCVRCQGLVTWRMKSWGTRRAAPSDSQKASQRHSERQKCEKNQCCTGGTKDSVGVIVIEKTKRPNREQQANSSKM